MHAWKTMLAIGLAIMFILLGFGGCIYLVDRGQTERMKIEQNK